MELNVSEEKTKALLSEIITEMIRDRRDVFYEIILEALEDVGLGRAITEGRNDEFVSEETIFNLLDNPR